MTERYSKNLYNGEQEQNAWQHCMKASEFSSRNIENPMSSLITTRVFFSNFLSQKLKMNKYF